MKKLIKNFALAAGLLVLSSMVAKAATVSATISSTTIATPSASLLLQPHESLSYTLTGTATGTIRIEMTRTGENWGPAGVSVTGAGVVSSSGKLFSGDNSMYYRWRASTMTAGSFVAGLADVDDLVQEVKNHKNANILSINDDSMAVSGGFTATSATFTYLATSGGTSSAETLTNPTLTGAITVNSGSTVTFTSSVRIAGAMTDVSTRTFAGAAFNGTKTDNSTTTYTGGQTMSGATISGTLTDSGTRTYSSASLSGTVTDSTTRTFSSGIINGTKTDNSTTTYTGTAVFSGSTSIKGVTNGTDANAGTYGEYVSSACSAVVMSTGVYNNICGTLTLGAGDWDLDATMTLFANGATYTRVDLESVISTSNGDNVSGGVTGDTYLIIDHTSGDTAFSYYSFAFPGKRKSISGSTTYYLKGYGGATSAGVPKMYGILTARRVR